MHTIRTMRLHALDAWVRDAAVLTDADALPPEHSHVARVRAREHRPALVRRPLWRRRAAGDLRAPRRRPRDRHLPAARRWLIGSASCARSRTQSVWPRASAAC